MNVDGGEIGGCANCGHDSRVEIGDGSVVDVNFPDHDLEEVGAGGCVESGDDDAELGRRLSSWEDDIDSIPVKRKLISQILRIGSLNVLVSGSKIAGAFVLAIAGECGEKIFPSLVCKDGDNSSLVDLDNIVPLGGLLTDKSDDIEEVAATVVDIIAEMDAEVGHLISLLNYHGNCQVLLHTG